MTWGSVVIQIVQYLVPAIGALLVALLGYLITYVSKYQQKIKNEVIRDSFGAALAEAQFVGRDAILATQQVLTDDLKKASADGKLTVEEQRAAIAKAQEYFIQHISTNSLNILTEAVGPIKNWLEAFLEAKLKEEKNSAQKEVAALADPSSPGLTD